MADQQVHRPADLPQNIAKEVTLFAADLIDHLPQRRRAGMGADRTTGLFRVVAILRPPAGKRLGVIAPVAGVGELLFLF